MKSFLDLFKLKNPQKVEASKKDASEITQISERELCAVSGAPQVKNEPEDQ